MEKSSGMGLCGVLFIVFLVLKLTGNITWSWWWVTSPLWLPIGIVVAVILFLLLIAKTIEAVDKVQKRK